LFITKKLAVLGSPEKMMQPAACCIIFLGSRRLGKPTEQAGCAEVGVSQFSTATRTTFNLPNTAALLH
jgi:hypothetical protein